MAKGASGDEQKSKKESWYSLSQEDTKLALTLLGGMVAVVVLCVFTPVTRMTTSSVRNLLGSSKAKAGKGLGSGVYYLGRVLMTLQKSDEYIDSEIDFEYDNGVLYKFTNGQVEGGPTANKFFKRQEARLRDAIVMESAGVDANEVRKRGGVDNLKLQLITAMNESFRDQDVITNIYFRKLLVFPSESAG